MSQSPYIAVSTNPEASRSNFVNQFDVGSPERSISDYMRIMHEHTKRQLNTATSSARRRSQGRSNSVGSQVESVSSTGS